MKDPVWDFLCLGTHRSMPPLVPYLGKGVPAEVNLSYQLALIALLNIVLIMNPLSLYYYSDIPIS